MTIGTLCLAMTLLVSYSTGTSSSSPSTGGLTTPEATTGVAGATASSLFNIRPLSIFTGHCNASIARGATIWKPIPGVVDVFFPKVVSQKAKLSFIIPLFSAAAVFFLFLYVRLAPKNVESPESAFIQPSIDLFFLSKFIISSGEHPKIGWQLLWYGTVVLLFKSKSFRFVYHSFFLHMGQYEEIHSAIWKLIWKRRGQCGSSQTWQNSCC